MKKFFIVIDTNIECAANHAKGIDGKSSQKRVKQVDRFNLLENINSICVRSEKFGERIELETDIKSFKQVAVDLEMLGAACLLRKNTLYINASSVVRVSKHLFFQNINFAVS